MGNPSGMIETESDTTVVNIVRADSPVAIPTPNNTAEIIPTITIIIRDKFLIFAFRGISVSIEEISLAIPPMTVADPVATTTAFPLPETTFVPLNNMFFWSETETMSD